MAFSSSLNVNPYTGKALFASQPSPSLRDWRPAAEEKRKQVLNASGTAQNAVLPNYFNFLNAIRAQGGGGVFGPQTGATNPFDPQVYIKTKDPELETAVQSILDRITGSNVNEITRDVRSPEIQSLIQSAIGNYGADTAESRAALEKFTRDYLGAGTGIAETVGRESDAIARVFGDASDPTSLISEFTRQADAANQAQGAIASRDIGDLVRGGKLAQFTGGRSSYVNKQLMDTAANILAQQAVRDAQTRRQNTLDVLNAQNTFAGRTQSAQEALASRGALPLQLAEALRSSNFSNLANLANTGLANTVTERVGDQLLRELGLVGGVRDLRSNLRFEGLTKDLQPDISGTIPFSLAPPQVSTGFSMQDLLGILGMVGGQNQGNAQSVTNLTDQFTKLLAQITQKGGNLPGTEGGIQVDPWLAQSFAQAGVQQIPKLTDAISVFSGF